MVLDSLCGGAQKPARDAELVVMQDVADETLRAACPRDGSVAALSGHITSLPEGGPLADEIVRLARAPSPSAASMLCVMYLAHDAVAFVRLGIQKDEVTSVQRVVATADPDQGRRAEAVRETTDRLRTVFGGDGALHLTKDCVFDGAEFVLDFATAIDGFWKVALGLIPSFVGGRRLSFAGVESLKQHVCANAPDILRGFKDARDAWAARSAAAIAFVMSAFPTRSSQSSPSLSNKAPDPNRRDESEFDDPLTTFEAPPPLFSLWARG
jgi:hypothetical protein